MEGNLIEEDRDQVAALLKKACKELSLLEVDDVWRMHEMDLMRKLNQITDYLNEAKAYS